MRAGIKWILRWAVDVGREFFDTGRLHGERSLAGLFRIVLMSHGLDVGFRFGTTTADVLVPSLGSSSAA